MNVILNTVSSCSAAYILLNNNLFCSHSIQTKILPLQDKPEDPEGSEGCIETPTDRKYKQDIENREDITQSNKNNQDIAQNTANILQQNDDRGLSTSPEPSVLSEPSANANSSKP